MLKLKNITKNYKVAGGEIKVLKGLSVCFRKNEFVSILGPSGCGKTTTLNIVGGLDKYTSGDLIISGKSTKNFTDRDWDKYRNHRIGFIFQSYNLIPHQTVLGNVELALTISGVSKEERVKRSLQALEKVGLKGEEYKRPNQLSGGQCQRVAIARALVNEPDILLADEPTGALDSKTSVQIMELIKEISKEKLVIMVTHNSELANEYSNRIIRLIDGEIVEDTNPFSEEEEEAEILKLSKTKTTSKNKKSKVKMSWWTAFKLSARNLFSKRKRTILTSIAGSIGIIGISAVLAVSAGVSGYIASMQDDMLSGNPITIEQTGYNFSSMMEGLTFEQKKSMIEKEGYVNVDSMIEFLAEQYKTMNSFMIENDLTEDYLNYVSKMPAEYGNIMFDYGLDVANNIYTGFNITAQKGETVSISGIKARYSSIMQKTQFSEQSSLIASLGEIFMQAIDNEEYILSQYDVIDGGRLASAYDEIMLVVNDDQTLTDLTLAQLGYYSQDEFMKLIYRVDEDETNDPTDYKDSFSFEELKSKTFTWYANDVVFNVNPANPNLSSYNAPFTYNDTVEEFTVQPNQDSVVEFKIVGILKAKKEISYGCLEAGVYYTKAFTQHVMEQNVNSQIVQFMKGDNGIDSFGGMIVSGMPLSINNSAIIPFSYDYYYEDYTTPIKASSMVGTLDTMSSILGGMMGGAGVGGDVYSLSARQLGGESLAESVKIYPTNFEIKDMVTDYLDQWNKEGDIVLDGKTITFEERSEVIYTDTLALIISMLNAMINIITIALISFTSLALVVSCVMISIITYVSVVERVKEIGVIRALGGRKKDVSNLFNAETAVIGATSGIFGVGFTYLMSFIVNLLVGKSAGFAIMNLQPLAAVIMISLSIVLTVISGLIPSKKAAHQDPVVALRTE